MKKLQLLAALVGLLAWRPIAHAAPDDEDEEESDDDKKPAKADDPPEEEEEDDEEEEDTGPEKPKPKQGGSSDGDFTKQDLSGHDQGTTKKKNEFEKDRFFVDKVDSKQTEKGTLVQGSLASSSFAYTESGGAYPVGMGQAGGQNAGKFSRYFTELRLQTDFRHISASRWDARIDTRARFVNTPGGDDPLSADQNRVQSGYNGTNEYDIREMWIIRSGKRSDVTIGRQYIADLAAVKIDGVRVDYASSEKLTLLGFGGLYPVRGSRSLTTDYLPLRNQDGTPTGGRFVAAAGFGGAYRTSNTYGALGGVLLYPVSAAGQLRVFATSNGYYRAGPQLDIYHYGLIDVIGQADQTNNTSGVHLTNLSAGLNYKPSQRLRVTAAYNRVDTDTLNAQARGFLDPADNGTTTVVNEQGKNIIRLATNQARVGVSAALGELQRFELSTAAAYRFRPDVNLISADGTMTTTLKATKGVDVYASLIDRRSFKDARVGLDVSRTFGVGAVPYQRTELLSLRAFVGHELADGRGEWEAEINYTTTKDANAGMTCGTASVDPNACFGSTTNTIISVGGNLFYRINSNWFALGSLNIARQATDVILNATRVTDPGIIGLTAFARLAYRF